MHQLYKLILILFYLFFIRVEVDAQPTFNFNELKERYRDDDACILTNKEFYSIDIDNSNKIKIHSEKTNEELLLNERAAVDSKKSIYYQESFSYLSNINAKTRIYSGGKLKEIKVEKINFGNLLQEEIFYEDIAEKYFYFPSLEEGAVKSLSYSEDSNEPHFPIVFYFGDTVPTISSEFIISFPENVKINYLLEDINKNVSVAEKRENGKVTYVFTAKNLEGFHKEYNSPYDIYYIPHIVINIESYLSNKKNVNITADLKGLYSWYRSLYNKMDDSSNSEIKLLTDSLIAGATNDDDKIRSIFYWVQDNIKYLAIEVGLGGMIPHNPKDILVRRYGDCKDKAVLLNLLLREAGFETFPAWIGTREIPYTYNDITSPIVNNHMITALRKDNQWVFLDGTSFFLPYKMPTSMIQGKDALIGISNDSFQIAKVVEVSAEQNLTDNSYKLALENGELTGHVESKVCGYPRELIMDEIQGLNYQKKIELIEKKIELSTNKYNISEFNFININSRDSALRYTFNISLKDYVSISDDNLYINLNLSRPLIDDKIDTQNRKSDRYFENKFIHKMEYTFTLPVGYKLFSLPSNLKYANDNFGCSFEYIAEKNVITLYSKIWVNTLLLKKNQFSEWNNFINMLIDSYSNLLVLKKA